jgi:aspartyl-tRNA(Asn)/glutamyl-tRNA(Gln) amidotransferase subunit A
MADLIYASAAELARLVSGKEVSPVEIVRAHLERITALDGALKAFITVTADAALAAAREAEAAVVAGRPLRPLHGVPLGLKDLYDTAGVRTTGGSTILRDRIPAADATVVRRLRDAGMIVLGKLNMVEFAFGPEGRNPHYGHARNPWDASTHRMAGGSSSGSGVAVAAGLAPVALGSDTGGSIRIPCSLCGLTGIKPTYGRVSRAGVLPLSWSMDHVGPMTRTAADAALVLAAMSGYDAADPTSSMLPVPDYSAALTGDVRGLRVGLLRTFFFESATPEVRAAVQTAATTLEKAGAVVDDVALPGVRHAAAGALAVVATEAMAYHAAWLRTRKADYDPDVSTRLMVGAFVTGAHVRARPAGEGAASARGRRRPRAPRCAPGAGHADHGARHRRAADDARRRTIRCPLRAHPSDASVQLLRPSGVLAAVRVRRGRIADRHADRRTAVRRGHRPARRRRVSASQRLARPAPCASVTRGGTMSEHTHDLDRRLAALESRLGRLESMLGTLDTKLDGTGDRFAEAKSSIQAWVTEYVSMRLQQLVPETCEHPEGEAQAIAEGPVLPGTRVRCTDEVLHRLGRIPIPFVRQMVTQKVAESARAEHIGLVDVAFFERTATF